jgi:hypothetical protein
MNRECVGDITSVSIESFYNLGEPKVLSTSQRFQIQTKHVAYFFA